MKSKRYYWIVVVLVFILISVQAVQADGYNLVTQWGGLGAGNGQFNAPRGIVVDKSASGYIFVNDENNDRIQRFDEDGNYQTQWSVSVGEGAIAVHPSGSSVFVYDDSSGQIIRTDINGVPTPTGTYSVPFTVSGIAVSPTNNIVYLSDSTNNQIHMYETDSGGAELGSWGSPGSGNSQFNYPRGIAIDSAGNVYVADSGNSRIQIFDSDGNYLDEFSYSSANTLSVDVDGSGRIYVIQNNGFSSWFTLHAGLTDPEYPLGWLLQTTGGFGNAYGIGVDSTGYVYIADPATHYVSKYEYPTTGNVDLSSSPSGAQIWIDGSDTGNVTRSLEPDLSPGYHPIIYKYPGYYDYEFSVLVMEGWTINYPIYQMRKIEPVPDFTATPVSGPAPLTVSFTDTSGESPTGWAWYFGDEDYTGAWTEQTSAAAWNPRYDHTAVAMYDGTIFLTSGYTGAYRRDLWWSTDNGITWTVPVPGMSGGWTPRYGHTTVAMPDGGIIVMGGLSSTGNMNDVWRSTDGGSVWGSPTISAAWSPRSGHTSVAMPDGSIVLMGGYDGTFRNDVWRSTDNGASWTPQTLNAEWSPRSDHSSVVMPDGSIVLTGGSGNNNEVWRSTDYGVSWKRMDITPPGWTPRYGHTSVAMPDGSIVLMGGDDGARRNDVWRSTDNGATWTQLSASAPWAPRSHASSVAMRDGSIVLTGGYSAAGTYYNDVWRLTPAGSSVQNPSHTYTAPGAYTVTLQAYNAGGPRSLQKSASINVINPALPGEVQDAVKVVVHNELGDDTTGKSVSAFNEVIVGGNPTLTLWGEDISGGAKTLTLSTGGLDCSLVTVDHAPEANWEHPVTHYCVDAAGNYDQADATSPATYNDAQFTYATGMTADPGEVWHPDDPYVWRQTCVNDCSGNYAVLISGGKDKDNNFNRYWNDIAFMYNNLIEYGYAPSHITVLMSDGSSSAIDRCIATSGVTCTQWDSSPRDLTGDGVYETIFAAKKNQVLNNLSYLKPGGTLALPAGANLTIFITGHGGVEATGPAYFYAWTPDGLNPYIRDTELMGKLNDLTQVNSITLVMETCFSGGFKDNFIDLPPSPSPATQKRVITTAANAEEWSYGNGFSNAWTTAVAGHTRYYGNACAQDAQCAMRETDKGADLLPTSFTDERISAIEGFNYAILKDPYATTEPGPVPGFEHPQIFANAAGADTATRFISECNAAATPKIFVTSPTTGDRWQRDTVVPVVWDAPGLAGRNVNITLLRSGANPTVIRDSVPATNPSRVEWTVPAGQTLSAAYTVKIMTLDAPVVYNSSKTFSVIAAPTTNYGRLTINAVNESGTVLAAAFTVSHLDGTVVATGTTGDTTGDITPLGTYNVTMTEPDHYPFGPASVKVEAGTKTVDYTMRFIPEGENGEDLDKEPWGGIDVSSTPAGAYVWFGKSGSVPANTSQYTPHVIILTEPGDYDVYVVKEGYQQSETRTVTVEIRTPTREPVKVDFTLRPETSSSYTFDGFYAPVSMGGVVNSAKAGQAIPVKWHLSDANGEDVSDPASFVGLRSYKMSCTEFTGDPVSAVEEYAPGSSGLVYLGGGNWQYNWMTPKNYATTTYGPCRKMYIEFEHDQKSDEAFFKFK